MKLSKGKETMNKEQVIAWLLERKDVLKISVVGKKTGISNLAKIIEGKPDGRGYPSTLSVEHLPKLQKFISDHTKK